MSSGTQNNKLRFDLTAEQIATLTDETIQNSKNAIDAIVAIPSTERNFQNTVVAYANHETQMQIAEESCTFPSYVSPIKEVRDAATAANKKFSAYNIEIEMREDLYQAMKEVQEDESMDEVDKRLLFKIKQMFERNGLHLPQETRDKIKELKTRISDLCIEFDKNVFDDTTTRSFTREELLGLPDDFIDNLQKSEDGKYVVSLKPPEYLPLMRKCKVAETRRAMEFAKETMCMEKNTKIMEEVLELRKEKSHILGFDNHANYNLAIRMAKNSKTVMDFLNNLVEKILPAAQKEKEKFLELKKRQTGDNFDGKLQAWDFHFYNYQILENDYQVDENEIKKYFPLNVVLPGLLEIYQELLGLKFVEIDKDNPKYDAWHEDVQMFEVFDSASGDYMGTFYIDLFPRDGKYNHAAMFSLMPCLRLPNGKAQRPVSAIVCNFTKPTKENPSLLTHDEVTTFFHEFGHLMHSICTDTKYARFSGTRVERDFVECPSQLMENWCFEAQALEKLSGHYQDNSKKLPAELVQKIIAAKNANAGLLNLRQLFFGLFDMICHTSEEKVDTQQLWEKLKKEITLAEYTPGTNGSASFSHIMGGYDAGYYGYMYSDVFSFDAFEVFKQHGILNQQIGRKYREDILSRGGTRDGGDMLRAFLGREPSPDPFLKSLGLL